MRDQNKGLSHPVMIAEPNKKKLDSFLGKDSPNEKPWTRFYYNPPNFLFFPMKAFSCPCHVGTCTWLAMVADPEFQFSADPK